MRWGDFWPAPTAARKPSAPWRRLRSPKPTACSCSFNSTAATTASNTLVNYENDAYYNARPTLNIPKNRVLRINETLGFHPELKDLKNLYDEGLLTAIQGIGYPNPNRSHFRSTDIWLSASDSDEYLSTGWLGRYLETQFPEFPDKIPEHPLAVDIGPVVSLSLLGKNGALGIALRTPGTFFNLVNQGNKIIDKNKIPTPAGYELEFIRQVNFESLQYASQVKEAAKKGKNKVTYPGTGLGSRLSLVSRLIHGGLRSRVYLVSQRGYDTHANQLARHTALLRELNDAVAAFQNDMERLGLKDRVLGLTISEFGRRVKENGSAGHGPRHRRAPLCVRTCRERGHPRRQPQLQQPGQPGRLFSRLRLPSDLRINPSTSGSVCPGILSGPSSQ